MNRPSEATLLEETERRLAEEALLNAELVRRERELQEYIDAMSTMNAKVAPDGTIVFVNRIAQLASGLTPEELKRTNFLEGNWFAYDPEVKARVIRAFNTALTGKPVNYEERLFVFNRLVTISFTLVPTFDAEGSVEYVIAEGADITRRVEAEQAMQAANQDLEAFTYSVSHDLRAPLRQIDGFSRILAEHIGPTLDERSRAYLARVQQGTDHMGKLIDDMLHLARVGKQDARSRPIALGTIVSEAIRDLQEDTNDRVIEWEIADLPIVEADPGLLKVVFTNLLSNALKYTRPRATAHIRIHSTTDGPNAVISVEDNGVGFDMKYAEKLFGVFQRLHRADQFEGTGVGLATVQRIIHKHGGRIWVSSEPDKGAKFFVTLKLTAPEPVAAGS